MPSDKKLVNDNRDRLDELKGSHAEVLHLRFIAGKLLKEIADHRGRSQGGVTVMIQRALEEFKRLVESGKPSNKKFVKDNQGRLDELKVSYAEVLRLRFIEDKLLREIAAHRGNTFAAARTMIQRALEELKRLVESGNPSDKKFVNDNQGQLDELKVSYATVLRQRFINNRSVREIADHRERFLSSVRAMIKKALNKLKQLVDEKSSGPKSPQGVATIAPIVLDCH